MHTELDSVDRRLLNDFQRDLPLTPRPFAAIAERLQIAEDEVLLRLHRLLAAGLISRIGPVFAPRRLGSSTLAAMAVPPSRLEQVAELINSYPEINHNYEREHRFNLWFVATAADQQRLEQVLEEIATRSELEVMSLPLEQDYHIDLGFPLQWSSEEEYERGI